jgi:hypothetical protein
VAKSRKSCVICTMSRTLTFEHTSKHVLAWGSSVDLARLALCEYVAVNWSKRNWFPQPAAFWPLHDNEMSDNVVSCRSCKPKRDVEQPVTSRACDVHRPFSPTRLPLGERGEGPSALSLYSGLSNLSVLALTPLPTLQTTTCVYCTISNNTVSVKSLFWSSLSFILVFSGKRRYLVPVQRVSGAFLPTTLHVRHPGFHQFLSVAHRRASQSLLPRNLRHFTTISSPISDHRNPTLHHG